MEFPDEPEWLCRKHPYQSCNGVCPVCLKNRLCLLCPDCASLRPCNCSEIPSSSSSSSSFSSSDFPKSVSGIGTVGRISYLIDSEPPFRRSQSAKSAAGFPFLRSRSTKPTAVAATTAATAASCAVSTSGTRSNPLESRHWFSFWSFFQPEKSRKEKSGKKSVKLLRSKSVGVSSYSDTGNNSGGNDVRFKGWGWSFASPIKVFRQSKAAKVMNQRSPLCRG